MQVSRATTIVKLLNSGHLACVSDNDFNEPDEFYVRVHVAKSGRQFQIKGKTGLSLIEVGLGEHGIDFKVMLKHATLENVYEFLCNL